MEKVTFTPAEFAAVFSRERSWSYRQLYAGKVNAVTDFGRIMIPKSEVERLLKEAGRYLGAGAKVKKTKAAQTKEKSASPGAAQWVKDIKRRKIRESSQKESDLSTLGSGSELPAPMHAASKRSVYLRLTRTERSRRGE